MKRMIIPIIILLIAGCERSTKINLGNDYQLITSSSFNDLTIVTSENIVVIKGHILNYAFDSNMIIVSQRPRDSIKGIGVLTYKEYKKAFKENDFKQYWIIDKSRSQVYDDKSHEFNNVYGPYTKDDYLLKREQLGVSPKLILKD